MEKEYWGLCDICDNETQVMVVNGDDVPCYCPLCGSDLEFDSLSDDDE